MLELIWSLFTDTKLGSLNLIIFALFVGACLAGFATVYHRRTIGALVRYLLEEQAFSPETAKTLRQAEQDLNIFVRVNITRNVAFQRIICMVDVPETDENGKKIRFTHTDCEPDGTILNKYVEEFE